MADLIFKPIASPLGLEVKKKNRTYEIIDIPRYRPTVRKEVRVSISLCFKRIAAYGVDLVFNTSALLSVFSLTFLLLQIPFEIVLKPKIMIAIIAFLFFFNWIIVLGQELAFQTSFGKSLFHLKLTQSSPSFIFLRALFFPISFIFLGVGLIWSLFDIKRRCWHDLATECEVQC